MRLVIRFLGLDLLDVDLTTDAAEEDDTARDLSGGNLGCERIESAGISTWDSPTGEKVTAMPDLLRITDDTTRAEIVSAITSVCDRAKRIPHVLGTEELPSEWDRRHEQIDRLLGDWEQASA